jgi:hypothetical protein
MVGLADLKKHLDVVKKSRWIIEDEEGGTKCQNQR